VAEGSREPQGAWAPLTGIRVVDFSMFVPGPFCSAIFADLGAEVIKVEAPRGDPGRSYVPAQFRMENRNKRSLALDLKSSSSAKVVERLATRCDIAIEGFRPGVAKRLGIGHDTLKKANPRIVYCSISGYGQTGPWRERPGHDVNYVAAAGALAFSGQWLRAPVRSSLPLADMAGGAFAAIAILAALQERSASGTGSYLDLSLFESAFFWAAQRHSLDPEADPRAHIFPVNDVFETADGKRLTLGILEEHFWENFLKVAPELREERFATDALRRQHGDELSRKIERTILSRGAEAWLKLLNDHDVPVDLCVTPAQAKENAQLKARQAVSGEFVRFPVWANGKPGGRIRSGVPERGEHSREILIELGFDDGEVAEMRRTGVVP
jgi:crotonobetainyl-CoA:carnitine CoA-transferase CaiB-like acyl-CoA transferase